MQQHVIAVEAGFITVGCDVHYREAQLLIEALRVLAGVDEHPLHLREFPCLSEPLQGKQPSEAPAVEVAPYPAPEEAGGIHRDLHFKAATRDDGAFMFDNQIRCG